MNLKHLTLFSGLLGFVVVALGAWTRLADAGLGCPDWPGCYGFATIPVNPDDIELANNRYPESPYEVAKAIPEVVHRYFAATLGLFIIGIFLAVRKSPTSTKNMKLLAGFLVFWVIIQGTFGYLTVSLKLWPQVVTTHLMSGFLTTVIIWLLYFKLKDAENSGRTPWDFNLNTKRLINLSLVVVSIQIFLGAWTSTNYASISCADLPLCRGQLLPPADFISGFNFLQTIGPNYLGGQLSDEARVAIHLTHRLGSIVATLVLLSLIFSLYRKRLLKAALSLLGVLALQISLGVSNVIFSLPLLIAVGHNLGGLLLITYLSALRFRD
jgi:cytochrome c oxidase assembly protein subunit 15|tara:strand:+ start:2111 stop:3085 length:975 start_codon:yes stop_codon:yes gene_type:complete